MTGNLLRNHWFEICRGCRCYWGKLTDEDLERIHGQFDRVVNALRTHYGFSRIKAEDGLECFVVRYADVPQAAARPGLAMAEASR